MYGAQDFQVLSRYCPASFVFFLKELFKTNLLVSMLDKQRMDNTANNCSDSVVEASYTAVLFTTAFLKHPSKKIYLHHCGLVPRTL